MDDSPHGPSCMCERCWARKTGVAAAEDVVPTTRAELLAALDRAFNAGVDAERRRAAREAQDKREQKR